MENLLKNLMELFLSYWNVNSHMNFLTTFEWYVILRNGRNIVGLEKKIYYKKINQVRFSIWISEVPLVMVDKRLFAGAVTCRLSLDFSLRSMGGGESTYSGYSIRICEWLMESERPLWLSLWMDFGSFWLPSFSIFTSCPCWPLTYIFSFSFS